MADTQLIAKLVNQMPDVDEPKTGADGKKETRDAGKLTGPAWPAAARIYNQILAAGPAGIVAVIDLIDEADNGQDFKARYTLHGLCIHCTRPEQSAQRAVLVQTLIDQLGANRPKPITGLLIRQLQVVGDKRAVAPIGKFLVDPDLYADAANALLTIREGAVQQFRAALPNTAGRTRLTIVQALGSLRDAASIDALKQAATDADADMRMAAVWGLANIADASAVDTVIKASSAQGYERVAATKACLMLAESLNAAGKKADARRIYEHLRTTRTDPKEKYIRNAAEAAMAG